MLSIPLDKLSFPNSNQAAASKLNSEAGDEFDHLQPHQQRSSSRQTFNRHSYLQQSPLTEETISLDDFDRRSLRSLQPKLIYTQEFSEGTIYILGQEALSFSCIRVHLFPSWLIWDRNQVHCACCSANMVLDHA